LGGCAAGKSVLETLLPTRIQRSQNLVFTLATMDKFRGQSAASDGAPARSRADPIGIDALRAALTELLDPAAARCSGSGNGMLRADSHSLMDQQ